MIYYTALEQVSVTVTGIPDRYIGNVDGNMRLKHPGTFNQMSGTWSWISSSSATFSMRAIPGAYDVHLRFWDDDDWRLMGAYSAPAVNIAAGTNTIAFSAFAVVEPITITVTGIPSRYIGEEEGGIMLNTPGLIDRVAEDWVWPIAASSTFTLFAMPGIYDVVLGFEFEADGSWDFVVYSAPRRNITAGANTIPFSAFSIVPQMSITVTGIPERYIEDHTGSWVDVDVVLARPGTENFVAYAWTWGSGSSIRMNLWDWHTEWVFNTPGTYDVYLMFWWSGGEAFYFAPSRNVGAGNTNIPFSAFTALDDNGRATARSGNREPPERTTHGRARARANPLRTR